MNTTKILWPTTNIQPKRKPLPAEFLHKEVFVDTDESDKVYDCCQSPLHKMDESGSEVLEFVPAYIKVIKTISPKYTCRQCEQNGTKSLVKNALMPPIPIKKVSQHPAY
jgi:transposase